MFFKLLRMEGKKLRNSKITLIIWAGPLLAVLVAYFSMFNVSGNVPPWIALMTQMMVPHAVLFLPLVTGVFTALLCSYEHSYGGWKMILTLPVSKWQVFLAKYMVSSLLVALVQVAFFICTAILGMIKGIQDPFPFMEILATITVGWLASLPLVAFQLWMAVYFSSFATPTVINALFALPTILIINSEKMGPLYPWSQPFLSMTQVFSQSIGGNAGFLISGQSFYLTIALSFILFLGLGITYFTKKQWT
ncbi:ABC transporter permease [Halobacillus sp. BAB-2008]|uniref:ABC transporter permease n=1 Tax=Halobacillus sp. BAB-2008 TaxID=1246484 RepID=UPI0002A4D8F4|nr:ABC transporter permease [Halobacillus sp. BAB-2008]ELK44280.1 hypothetical protein D479_19803 [Halobacillus sp. BAB-2008]